MKDEPERHDVSPSDPRDLAFTSVLPDTEPSPGRKRRQILYQHVFFAWFSGLTLGSVITYGTSVMANALGEELGWDGRTMVFSVSLVALTLCVFILLRILNRR